MVREKKGGRLGGIAVVYIYIYEGEMKSNLSSFRGPFLILGK